MSLTSSTLAPFLPNNFAAGTGHANDPFDYYNKQTMGTPNWMIFSDGIFESLTEGDADYKKSYMCYDIDVFLAHNIQGNSTAAHYDATSSGVLTHGNVVVYMPMGKHSITLKKHLSIATIIKEIRLMRMAIINGDKTPVQLMSFFNCVICKFQQKNDTIKFDFRFTNLSDTFLSFDQKTGEMKGTTGVTIDMTTWQIADAK